MSLKNVFYRIKHWESWPFKLLYAPITPVWGWYMLRSRAVWFFTPSNPKITFGGMEGEPKKEMYALLPEGTYPSTIVAKPEESLDVIKERISANGISYPFIVKPEVGWQGVLLRKIDNEAALINYHSNMFDEYIIQALVTYPLEVSVFYIRHPEEKSGRITGFLQKIPLQVVGDGVSTLESLAMKHPKAHIVWKFFGLNFQKNLFQN